MLRINGKQTDFFQFNNLSKFSDLNHFISTNIKKKKRSYSNDLDISYTTGKKHQDILENRKILSKAVDIPLDQFVMQDQVHGNLVKIIDKSYKGLGVHNHKDAINDSDAMITDEKGICLFLFAADCVPIIFYDPVKEIIGAAHSGWKGTVKRIAQNTIIEMHKNYGTNYKDIRVGIGPSISVKNYEIGKNVVDAANDSFGLKGNYLQLNNNSGNYHFDLQYTVRSQLIEIGVLSKNIETSNLCTYERQDLFFSARANKNTGRFGAGIMLL